MLARSRRRARCVQEEARITRVSRCGLTANVSGKGRLAKHQFNGSTCSGQAAVYSSDGKVGDRSKCARHDLWLGELGSTADTG